MAQRPPAGNAARRGRPAPVKQPFPWGVVAGWSLLVLLLGSILVYASVHQGEGAGSAIKTADASVGSGLAKYDNLGRHHRTGPLHYAQSPPVGGDHNPVWESCQIYTQPIPNEHAVHSLEHGAVWVTYRPDLPADQVRTLMLLVQGSPYRLLSPYPGLRSPVSLQAWGRQIFLEKASDPRARKFADAYTQGPQTPEAGASCRGGVTVTGSVPQDPPAAPASPTTPVGVTPAAVPSGSTGPAASAPAAPAASATPVSSPS